MEMTKEEHRRYLRERDIDELISWLGYIKQDFVDGKCNIYHQQTVCRMINTLYGGKAIPNKNNRSKVKHMRRFKRGWC